MMRRVSQYFNLHEEIYKIVGRWWSSLVSPAPGMVYATTVGHGKWFKCVNMIWYGNIFRQFVVICVSWSAQSWALEDGWMEDIQPGCCSMLLKPRNTWHSHKAAKIARCADTQPEKTIDHPHHLTLTRSKILSKETVQTHVRGRVRGNDFYESWELL